jgi:hypothetical protein
MGQRHQLYIRILNPVNIHQSTYLEKQMFGTEKYTILAFHNQWLYGRSALQHALNILEHINEFSIGKLTDKEEYGGYHSPFTYHGIETRFQSTKKWTDSIAFIMNWLPKNMVFSEAGFMDSWCLNYEDFPEAVCDDFRGGDNNDGVTLIDVVTKKYCFININEYDDTISNNSSDLPYLKPCTAHEYVRTYYPESIEMCSEYKKANTPKIEGEIKRNIRLNAKFHKKFNKFELLNVEGIITMFPTVKKDLLKAQKRKNKLAQLTTI